MSFSKGKDVSYTLAQELKEKKQVTIIFYLMPYLDSYIPLSLYNLYHVSGKTTVRNTSSFFY